MERVLDKVSWNSIYKKNIVVAGNINADSKEWDNNWKEPKVKGKGIERVQAMELEIKNNPSQIIRWKSYGRERYVIDLNLATGRLKIHDWTTNRKGN
jgi:hypothetical protein